MAAAAAIPRELGTPLIVSPDDATIYLGNIKTAKAWHARDRGGEHLLVNCSGVELASQFPDCLHLSLTYMGEVELWTGGEPMEWEQRIFYCLSQVREKLDSGSDVFLFCQSGELRSAAFGVCALFLLDTSRSFPECFEAVVESLQLQPLRGEQLHEMVAKLDLENIMVQNTKRQLTYDFASDETVKESFDQALQESEERPKQHFPNLRWRGERGSHGQQGQQRSPHGHEDQRRGPHGQQDRRGPRGQQDRRGQGGQQDRRGQGGQRSSGSSSASAIGAAPARADNQPVVKRMKFITMQAWVCPECESINTDMNAMCGSCGYMVA
jgi:hypothetical protein